jgi:hypothetical protein
MIETVKEEMLWFVLRKWYWRWDHDLPSPAEDQRPSQAHELGELGDRAAFDSSWFSFLRGPKYRIPPDAALEACDAPKSSRVIDGPEQGTGQGTSACGWRDEDKRKVLYTVGTVQNL